jgi:acyl-homoserine-lactone acylase
MGALLKVGAPEEWFRMNKAKNFTEFKQALDMQQISRQTVIYADRNDTIYILSNGLLPNRNPNYNWQGVLPGDTSATLWTTFHPESELPQLVNPSCGYVFNTNNSAFDCSGFNCDLDPAKYDPTMGYSLEKDNRSVRFHEVMANYNKVDWNDFLKIKYDEHYPVNDSLVPSFGTYPQGFIHLDPKKHPDIADAINTIQHGRHDGELDNPDLPILIFSLYQMRQETIGGIDYEHNPVALDSVSYKSVKKAQEHMIKYFGSIHVPLGKVQFLVRDSVEMPVPGGPDMIRATYCNPYKDGKLSMWIGESYIQLVKFKKGELPHIESVAPYGASNTPGSKHYTDQMKLSTHNERKVMSLDKNYVYKHAESVYHPK